MCGSNSGWPDCRRSVRLRRFFHSRPLPAISILIKRRTHTHVHAYIHEHTCAGGLARAAAAAVEAATTAAVVAAVVATAMMSMRPCMRWPRCYGLSPVLTGASSLRSCPDV